MSATLLSIDAGRRPLADHEEVAGRDAIERVREAARPLAGARVLHLTAAGATTSQAPQYLRSLLPLLADAGLEVRWAALADGLAIKVGDWLAEGIAGAELAVGDGEWADYLEACEQALRGQLAELDLVVIHDEAALGTALAAAGEGPRFAWHAHHDASRADSAAAGRLAQLIEALDAVAAPAPELAAAGTQARTIAPALDPLNPRNHELPRKLSGQVLRSLGLDLSRPFVCQTGAIDRWSDPHTALDAFDALRTELPELQLVIAGPLPGEGGGDARIAKEVENYASGRPDAHVKTGYGGVGNVELNAIQRVARAGLSQSLRAETGPARLETWWKGTPVVGSGSAGPLAVDDGADGYAAEEPETVAARIAELVRDPGLAIELGAAGRERVRRHHLITRAALDELELVAELLGAPAP